MHPSHPATSTDAGSFDADLTERSHALGGDDEIEPSSTALGERSEAGLTRIGRYELSDVLGAGGMGTVFAARDPELDRNVAIKLINPRREHSARQAERECARLRAEAQALARLSHPNVVHVYEVGSHEGRTFLAMELVEGPTLAEWQREAPGAGSLDELLAVYAQAGRGLAAAHAAGLAHRDFKPANVLIGRDGWVRVVDFGLAVPRRALAEAAPTQTQTMISASEDGPPRPGRAGPGTLPYMAPEQAFMGTGDAAADQFSFCVALFEAVYGARPFPAEGVMELLYKLDAGAVEFPERRGVPRWLRRLLLRGLARRPEQRFPSMDALLDELTRERRWSRRRGVRLGAIAALAGVIAAGAVYASADKPPVRAREASLDGVWDADRQAALARAFTELERPWIAGSEAAVISELDAWARRWLAQAAGAGVDRPSLVAALLPGAGGVATCLDAQREQARFTVDALIAGDSVLLEGAVAAVDALPEPSRCASAALELGGEEPLAAELLLAELRSLADASAQRELGRYALARSAADAVVRAAEARDQARERDPLLLAALRQRGLAELAAGHREAGIADLIRARGLAIRTSDHRSATELALDLAWAGRKLDNLALRREWLTQARDRAAALDADDRHARLLRVRVELVAALDHLDAGEPEWAERSLVAGLEALEELGEGGSILALDHLHALANAYDKVGQREHAEQVYLRALAHAERIRGRGHPSNASVWHDAGALALDRGQLELARERLTQADTLRRDSLAFGHPLRTRSRLALAQLELRADNSATAEAHARAALKEVDDDDEELLADLSTLLGQLRARAHDWEGAVEHYQRAVDLLAASDSHRAFVELELGLTLSRLGHHTRAVSHIEPALAIVSEHYGPERAGHLIPVYERYAASLRALGREPDAQAVPFR